MDQESWQKFMHDPFLAGSQNGEALRVCVGHAPTQTPSNWGGAAREQERIATAVLRNLALDEEQAKKLHNDLLPLPVNMSEGDVAWDKRSRSPLEKTLGDSVDARAASSKAWLQSAVMGMSTLYGCPQSLNKQDRAKAFRNRRMAKPEERISDQEGNVIAAGLCGIGKGKEFLNKHGDMVEDLQLIINRVRANVAFKDFDGDAATLPDLGPWRALDLEKCEIFAWAEEILKTACYLLQLPEIWEKFMLIDLFVPGSWFREERAEGLSIRLYQDVDGTTPSSVASETLAEIFPSLSAVMTVCEYDGNTELPSRPQCQRCRRRPGSRRLCPR